MTILNTNFFLKYKFIIFQLHSNSIFIVDAVLDDIKWRETLDFIKCKDLSLSSQKVLDALYTFLGYTEEHDIKNFNEKIKVGMTSLPNYLKELKLSKISNNNYFKARRILRNVNEEDIKDDNNVAHILYSWLCPVLNLDIDQTLNQADSTSIKKQDSEENKTYQQQTDTTRDDSRYDNRSSYNYSQRQSSQQESSPNNFQNKGRRYGSGDPIIEEEPANNSSPPHEDEEKEKPEKFIREESSSYPTKYTLERDQSAYIEAGPAAWRNLGMYNLKLLQ